MAKVIGLSIEIDGLSEITKEVVGLEQQLKNLNTELKNTEVGSDAYIDLRNQIAATKEQLSQARKEQKDFIKSAEATKEAEGSYFQLNRQLIDLKKQYKSLSAAERESAKGQELKSKIQALDTELKQIDGSIGQFQRNVGNYPKTFAIINRSLIRTIPGFEAFSDTLKDAEGNINSFGKALIAGFIAFQAAKFVGQAIKALDDFNKKMEETRDTVAQFSKAYGEDLDSMTASTKALADTFDTDAETISKAAESLSKRMGISFQDALGQIEGALVEGRGNATDYLEKITEFPEAFTAASGAVSELSERNKMLLGANKELATSQVNIAKETQKLGDGFKAVTATVQNTFIVILLRLIDVFKPLWTAAYELFEAMQDLGQAFISVFTGGQKTVSLIDTFTGAIKLLVAPIKVALNILTGLFNILKPLAPAIGAVVTAIVGYRLAIQAATIAQKAFNAAAKANPIGFIVGAATTAAGALASYAMSTDDAAKKQEELAAAEMKAAEEAEKAAAERMKAEEARIKAAEEAAQKEKELEEQRKKAEQEALQRFLKLQEARRRYAEQEAKDERARIALLADLQSRLLDEQIKNIEDGRERELAEVENTANARLAALEKQYEDLKLAAAEREKELIEIFGAGSKEVLQTQQANAKLLQQVQAEQAKIAEQIEAQKVQKQKEINDAYRKDELEKAKAEAEKLRQLRDEQLATEISFIDNVGEQRALKNQETLNRLLIQEGDAKKREGLIRKAEEERILAEIENIRNKQQALTDQEEFLKAQAAEGVEIKQEEFDAILQARQKLNTELSSLELQQTEIIRQEAEKQTQIRKDNFEKIAGYAQQGLDIIDTVVSAINARAEADVEKQLERSTERQDQLNEEIENATGLRKKFLQQRLDAEVKAADELAKKQEQIQRRQAKVQKGIAATQSVIQGILSVQTALASAPPPANFVAATLAGIAAAANTAAILAQPLASGGAVSPVVLPDSGGRVVAAQNIPTTGRGDNVLVAARVGETFLNAKQTKILRPALAAAKVPGFANGGLLGAPNVSGIGGNTGLLRAMNERSAAISNQVLESKVYLVTDELKRDTAEGERIKKKVTLR